METRLFVGAIPILLLTLLLCIPLAASLPSTNVQPDTQYQYQYQDQQAPSDTTKNIPSQPTLTTTPKPKQQTQPVLLDDDFFDSDHDLCVCQCCKVLQDGKMHCTDKTGARFLVPTCRECYWQQCILEFPDVCDVVKTPVVKVKCIERDAFHLRVLPLIVLGILFMMICYVFVRSYRKSNTPSRQDVQEIR